MSSTIQTSRRFGRCALALGVIAAAGLFVALIREPGPAHACHTSDHCIEERFEDIFLNDPKTRIAERPSQFTSSPDARFTFYSYKPLAQFECRLNSEREEDYEPCGQAVGFGLGGQLSGERSYAELPDGEHRFEVRAVDMLGVRDPDPPEHRWTIDTVPPLSEIVEHPPERTNSRRARFALVATEPGASFECRLNEGAYQPCGPEHEYVNLGEREHTFTVRATDQAGNVEVSPPSYTWTVDLTAPVTEIVSRPPDPSRSRDAEFTLAVDDPDASLECALDTAELSPCKQTVSYSELDEGEHTFRARATDDVGNTEKLGPSYTWTIDLSVPTEPDAPRVPGAPRAPDAGPGPGLETDGQPSPPR